MASSEMDAVIFGPATASVRRHLGQFVDEWMGAKIELVRNLKARIAVEKDKKKLPALRAELMDAFISKEDIQQMDQRIQAFQEMLDSNVSRFLATKKKVVDWEKEQKTRQ